MNRQCEITRMNIYFLKFLYMPLSNTAIHQWHPFDYSILKQRSQNIPPYRVQVTILQTSYRMCPERTYWMLGCDLKYGFFACFCLRFFFLCRCSDFLSKSLNIMWMIVRVIPLDYTRFTFMCDNTVIGFASPY